MLDEELRAGAKRFYRPAARALATRMGADAVTLWGLAVGLLCLGAAALGLNLLALVLWLANRLLDGLDGEVARLEGDPSHLGAYFDIIADFVLYGGLLAALAIAHPEARLSLVFLFFAYYLNGSSFLALSSVLERLRAERDNERGLHFRRSLAEGFETIVFGVLVLALPAHVSLVCWVFTAMVFVSALGRLFDAHRLLRDL